jgi:hypothetical protein
MPYIGERASRLGHVPTASNPLVAEALDRWDVPSITIDPGALEHRVHALSSLLDVGLTQPRFAVAFDGSDSEIVARADYPSVTVGYIQIAGTLTDLQQFFGSRSDGVVDPRALKASMTMSSVSGVLPGAQVTVPGLTGVESFRSETASMFSACGFEVPGNRYISLTDALLTMHGAPGRPAQSIELSKCPVDGTPAASIPGGISTRSATTSCTHCGGDIWVTDVLRAYEEFTDHGGNLSAYTRIMNTAERLLCLGYVDWMNSAVDHALGMTIFIQDGPLAFHGTTAPLKRRWISYWEQLVTSLGSRTINMPMVVGIEKSGPFVDHANALARHLPECSVMSLDNNYIQTRILANDPGATYGKDEFYGRRFIYKTSTGQMLVVTVPRINGSPYEKISGGITGTCQDINQYPMLRPILETLDRVQSRLYPGAVVPIALAHSTASLPLGTGSRVLTQLAREHLGLSETPSPRRATFDTSWN